MKNQMVKIPKIESFDVKHIFECGQCFRWNAIENNIYIGVVGQNVIEVTQKENEVIFESIGEDNLEELVNRYFDLTRDYEDIKNTLSNVDNYLKESISYGCGIRILNQDLWETILSFIISANNHIPRIKGIIERLSKAYGDEIIFKEKSYYTFPSLEQLKNVTVEEYRNLGLGFRDIRMYETVKMIKNGDVKLEDLYKMDTSEAKEKLLLLSGVGPKVADCILLFSDLKRMDVFPIDVWVRRVMNELYIKEKEEKKVSKKQILSIAKEKFGSLEGLAQQYLFYWRREEKKQA